MNIKQIRYFVTVFNDGSLSAAAKKQYVTVQAVSKAIADLERELKNELFVRESRGVHPTQFGKAFYAKAEPVLRDFDELEAFAHNRRMECASLLRLGLCTPPFYGSEQACASIASFSTKNVGIETTVALETGARGAEALRIGRVDALISIGSHEYDEFDCLTIGKVLPGVSMARTHPLAQKATVTLDDIKPYPIVISNDFNDFNDVVTRAYRTSGLDIRLCPAGADQFDAFVMREKGLAFVVGIPALGEMHPGTTMKMIAQKDAVSIPICLVSLKNGKTPAYRALERWLMNVALVGTDPIKRFSASAHA